ncbi:MAG: hypothetical protein KC619_14500 [Myxococcales bacterium]|nr:hypothetical protein [Myxococcales bacterium]
MARSMWVAVIFLLAAPAAAQEATAEGLDAEARARFELAMVHIQNGRFEAAAGEFHHAWELSHRDELLYNEFLAWRDGGLFPQAATALQAYLDTLDEDDEDRPNLEARLRVLREQIESGDEGAAGEAATPTAAGGAPHPIGFVLMGAGAAIAIAGAVTGGVALSISDSLAAECTGGVCPESRRGDLDAGPALAFTTDVLLPVGAVTAVVGLVLALAITEPAETAPVRAGVGCDAHGCAASVGGTF